MARRYNVSFEKISVAAVQDLLSIAGASGKTCRVIEISVAAVDAAAPTNGQLALRASLLTATVTAGSGGAAVTPRPFDIGDAAASFTARRNDTTQATSSGAKTTVREDGCNIYAGYSYMFPSPPVVGPSQSFVFELITTPGATYTLSGNIVVEEMGG